MFATLQSGQLTTVDPVQDRDRHHEGCEHDHDHPESSGTRISGAALDAEAVCTGCGREFVVHASRRRDERSAVSLT
jgi:ABC-type nickel/cobalt efflux system permease component RcnA